MEFFKLKKLILKKTIFYKEEVKKMFWIFGRNQMVRQFPRKDF